MKIEHWNVPASPNADVAGKIIDINENWIEVETKKGVEVINAEFLQGIKIN